jgi:circadian clock protein KaiC
VTAPNDRPPGVPAARPGLVKVPTGIRGFDELTGGGLPAGRPTLVTGGAGSGKTLFGLEFLVRGAQELDEPGVLLAFEELAPDLADNAASLGFDLPAL